MGNHPTQELDESGNFECLGYSNWTICSPSNPSCSQNFPTFSLSYWEANSYYPRGLIMGNGESPNSRIEWEKQLECLGHSNWTICITLSPSSSKIIPTFPLLYWEANSSYPTRLIIQLKNLMRVVVTFWAWCEVCGLLTQRCSCSKISTTSFNHGTRGFALCIAHWSVTDAASTRMRGC